MSRLFLSLIFFCFFPTLQTEAQTPGMSGRRTGGGWSKAFDEQMQVERIAYFTEKIGLTAEEAQFFWPVYNEMDKRRTALFEERASIIHKFMNDADKLTDKQIDEQLNRLTAILQQETALPSEYDAKFRKVLSARKVMNLYVAEMGFRNYLLQKMRNRRDAERPEKPEKQ
jgi:hypothetical protein